MKDQHTMIKGYRDLSAEEIALMNEIKAHAAKTEELFEKVKAHVENQFDQGAGSSALTPEAGQNEWKRLMQADPMGWALQAKLDLQVGFMKLVRAVAQPGSF